MTTISPPTMEITGIFMAILILLLAAVMVTRWLSNIGQAGGNAGLSMTKWVILLLLGLGTFWGLYNEIGKVTGSWESLTFDKYFGGIVQWIYGFVAKVIQWIQGLLNMNK
jgi:hypothetical protein